MNSHFNIIFKWWQDNHFQKLGTTVSVLLSSNQNYNINIAKSLDGEMKRQIKMAASIEH